MMGEQQRGGKDASWRALGAMIPADHILLRIDGLIDLGELRDVLAPHYSRRGRPSIAPELLVRMALIARLYGITSERRLCEEVRFNLAYRWFCRLPIDARVPHHSTFSKNRHGRFRDAGIFRILFEQTVRRCADAGLIAHKDAAIVDRPFNCGFVNCGFVLLRQGSGSFSRSSLMMAFGGGRLDVWNDVRCLRVSRSSEIAYTTVLGGGTTGA